MNEVIKKIQNIIFNASAVKRTVQTENDMNELFADAENAANNDSTCETEIVKFALDYFEVPYMRTRFNDFASELYGDQWQMSDWEMILHQLPHLIIQKSFIELITDRICEKFKSSADYELYRETVQSTLTEAQNTYGTANFSYDQIMLYMKSVEDALSLINAYDHIEIAEIKKSIKEFYPVYIRKCYYHSGLIWEFLDYMIESARHTIEINKLAEDITRKKKKHN